MTLVAIAAAVAVVARRWIAGPSAETTVDVPVFQFGGAVTALAAGPDALYVAAGRRLQVVDDSDPARPKPLGQTDALPESVRAIALVPGHALVGAGTAGLIVYDVTDPGHVRQVASLPTSWSVNDVAVAGNLALLAEGARGLRLVDVANPTDPRPVGSLDTPGDALAVAVGGETAYVADWGTGVRLIDIADAAAPREIAAIETPGEAADLALDGTTLFVADRSGGLRTVDVSAPDQPRETGALPISPSAERVAAFDGRAYVAASEGGVLVVDATDPARPSVVGRFTDATMAVDVLARKGAVYIADVGTNVAPERDVRGDLWGRLHMWGVEGDLLTAEGQAGVYITRPTDGTLVGVGLHLSPSMIESAAVLAPAGVMYLADGRAGVIVLDVSEPDAPTLIGTLASAGSSHDVLLDGARGLVAAGPAGLVVLDLADPRDPRISAVIDTPGEAVGVAVTGDIAYVADGDRGGLRVIDLAQRREVTGMDTPGVAWDVKVAGGYAYLSDRTSLIVYDLSDPRAPREVATALDHEGDVLDVAVAGTRVWVAAGPAGVLVLDVSDPTAPRRVSSLPLQDRAIGIVLSMPVAYVAAGGAGLLELEMGSGDRLRQSRAWAMPGAAERLARYGDWAYVATETGGLQVVRLTR